MDLENATQIFDHLYHDINGYSLSAQGRQEIRKSSKSLTYGEVTPKEFHQILQKVSPKNGEIIYDLGSGTGKAVVLAALLTNFERCIGIELISQLHETAESVLKRLEVEFKLKEANKIEFVNDNFLSLDFSDGDVFFLHSTCFDETLMPAVEKKLRESKKGARIVTVTRNLNNKLFDLYDTREYNMGWGKATCFFYKKT